MMKQVPPDKYTIAWFKLAECVARGEREKALGVYRLLAHSLDDKAYAYQLEGDLLWALGDNRAHERYALAAQSYREENRMRQAAALYEHLHYLVPSEDAYLDHLAHAYSALSAKEQLSTALKKLYERALDRADYSKASELLEQIIENTLVNDHESLLKHHILVLIKKVPAAKEVILMYLERTIELLCKNKNEAQVSQLLQELEQINSAYYKHAQKMIQLFD